MRHNEVSRRRYFHIAVVKTGIIVLIILIKAGAFTLAAIKARGGRGRSTRMFDGTHICVHFEMFIFYEPACQSKVTG